MSDTNDMRKEFEALAKTHELDLTPDDCDEGFYNSGRTDLAWIFWEAATERAAASQWVSVEYQLPELSKECLLYCGYHVLGYRSDYDNDPKNHDGWVIDFDNGSGGAITDWMPLPTPPAIRQGGAK